MTPSGRHMSGPRSLTVGRCRHVSSLSATCRPGCLWRSGQRSSWWWTHRAGERKGNMHIQKSLTNWGMVIYKCISEKLGHHLFRHLVTGYLALNHYLNQWWHDIVSRTLKNRPGWNLNQNIIIFIYQMLVKMSFAKWWVMFKPPCVKSFISIAAKTSQKYMEMNF